MKMDILNKWMMVHRVVGEIMDCVTERIICRDGYSFSCQANEYAYCNPKKTNAFPYTSFELGYPSDKDKLIDIYAENPNATKDENGCIHTVYPYVPVQTVIELIKKHGGFVIGASAVDIEIEQAGYKLITPGMINHLIYKKSLNGNKMRVVDINLKDFKITCYLKHVLGPSRMTTLTKAEKRMFNAKLKECGELNE